MGWRADGGLWLLVRGGGLYLSKGTGVSLFSIEPLSLSFYYLFHSFYLLNYSQITEDFEEVPVQSRGFGILDVGFRSQVLTLIF